MSTIQTILDISIFFWLLPPIRQFKGRFFYYFLVMALSDPINIFCFQVLKTPQYLIHSVAGLFLIFSLIFLSDGVRKRLFIISALVFGFFIGMILLPDFVYLLLSMHIVIFLILIKIAVMPVYQKNIVNIFYFALLFYELSLVLNISLILGSGDIRIILYFSTLSFQILMAIFFTIFTEKSEILIRHLKETESSNIQP